MGLTVEGLRGGLFWLREAIISEPRKTSRPKTERFSRSFLAYTRVSHNQSSIWADDLVNGQSEVEEDKWKAKIDLSDIELEFGGERYQKVRARERVCVRESEI